MKFNKLNDGQVNVNISKYIIDWDKTISKPQKTVSDFLRPYWEGQTVLCEFRIPGSLLRIDLLNITSQVIIETSPDELHFNYNKFLHKNRFGFIKKLKSDNAKREWAEKSGFLFIELNSKDIKNLSISLLKDKGLEL